MTLSPEQIAKIRQKEADTPDALKRNPLNDYMVGWFHVTLNVRREAPVLGFVVGDADAPDGSDCAPRCMLTELGRKVEKEWRDVGRFHPFCSCEEIQVMPNHLHVLFHLQEGNQCHLGRIINGLMIGSTHLYWDTLGIRWREMRQQLDALKRGDVKGRAYSAQWQDRDHTRSFRDPALFVRGYNDVEAVTEQEIAIKRQYIRDNPRKHRVQSENCECFRKYRHQHSRNWSMERVKNAIAADRALGHDAQRREKAMESVRAILNTDVTTAGQESSIVLDYIGHKALLYSSMKLPLVCHRADAHLFEQQKEAVLRSAREHGAIIVSAFISPKERDIREQLLVEQLPFIEIMDNGISDKYKGVGKSFYALAEERLCQVSPWRYQYQRETTVSREKCLVMNELARVISEETDDWWKK